MNEVKIQIPDNCELIKDGDTYIVKEKKQVPPKSWEEFCERYSLKNGEAYISPDSTINVADYKCKCSRNVLKDKNWCTSKEEAEAFLALMQLRQLRKAWIGKWEYDKSAIAYAIMARRNGSMEVGAYDSIYRNMLFPTKEMAKDFLNCFRDLCETAKTLL